MRTVHAGPLTAVFDVRPDTTDDIVLDESWDTNAYHVEPHMLEGKVVVDIGANIGAFAVLAAMHGAKIVHAYEPDEDSLRQLRKNLQRNRVHEVVRVWPEAVGPSARTVAFNGGHSGGSHVTRPGEGSYDVAMVSLATVIERAGGRVGFMKIDCEGGEYRMFQGGDPVDLTVVDRIGMEFHNQCWGVPTDGDTAPLSALLMLLMTHGHIETHGVPTLGGMIYWHRYGV